MFRQNGKVSWHGGIGLSVLLAILLACVTIVSAQEPQVAIYVNSSEVVVFWDPSEGFSNEVIVMNNLYETLVRYDSVTGEFTPVLATSYESSADGLTWTFHLRKGVKFHTGGEMDAEAVKFSIDRTIAGEKGAFYIWDAVESIEAKDKYTVVFHLSYPAPLDIAASAAYCAHIFDPDFSDRDWFYEGNDSGTGPYTIESNEGNTLVILKKFDDYWRGWEGKHFDKIVFQWVPEEGTRRLMVESGEADFTNRLAPSELEALRGVPGVEIVSVPSFQNLLALYNTAKSEDEPIGNPLVRKALAYALPYDDVVNSVMEGYARQSRGVVPFGLWGNSDKVKQYTFSPETAKLLLEQAGYPDGGFKVVLTYVAGDENERRTAELWKSELAKLGVNLEIRGMPWEAQIDLGSAADPNERQDIFLFYWWPDYADPHSFLSAMFETQPILFNFSYYSNPVYDALINAAKQKALLNRKAATDMYVEAQNILMADAVGVAVFDMSSMRAKRMSLKGYVDNPAYTHVVFWYDCYREE